MAYRITTFLMTLSYLQGHHLLHSFTNVITVASVSLQR